jgi:hypothetical protein
VTSTDEEAVDGMARVKSAYAIGERIIVLSADKIAGKWPLGHDHEYLLDLTTCFINGCHEAIDESAE